MASKRVYITIPLRDWRLIQRYGLMTNQCVGQLARMWTLTALYRLLGEDADLQAYDQALAWAERKEIIRGG